MAFERNSNYELFTMEYNSHIMIFTLDIKILDTSHAAELKRTLEIAFRNSEARYYIIDITNLRMIDSSGIAVLIALYKTIGNRGELLVTGQSQAISKIFKMTNLSRLLSFYSTTLDALNYCEEQLAEA